MSNEELFANAKDIVFGQPPIGGIAMIGYQMSVNYFEPLVNEAEAIMLGIEVPRKSFELYLKNAFQFAAYDGFDRLPVEARTIIERCTTRFKRRYEPLFVSLSTKAA